MKTYTVTFQSPTHWADQTIRARTPEQALARARKTVERDPRSLDWDSYHSADVETLEEIVVCDETGAALATWRSAEYCLSLAAGQMLAALEIALERLQVGNYAGEEGPFIKQVEAAIASAMGRPSPITE